MIDNNRQVKILSPQERLIEIELEKTELVMCYEREFSKLEREARDIRERILND